MPAHRLLDLPTGDHEPVTSCIPTEADFDAIWADLGDDPTPATLNLNSPEHDAEMSAWFEAEFAELC